MLWRYLPKDTDDADRYNAERTSKDEVVWDSWHPKDIRRQSTYYFAWTFAHEKAVFEVGAALAHFLQQRVDDSNRCFGYLAYIW